MRILPLLLLLPLSIAAGQQTPANRAPAKKPAPAARADTASADNDAEEGADDEGVPLGMQFGVATGALSYGGGRHEQGFGVIARWAPRRWIAVSATPSAVRVSMPASGTLQPAVSRTGLTDLPVELTLSHPFAVQFAPTLSLGLGASLPVGDTASGFGAGQMSYSTSLGLGFAPVEGVWAHIGAGKSLSGVSPQAALTTGSGWGDVSAGTSVTDRLSLSAGFSSDLGAVDTTFGRSTSVTGGFAVLVQGHQTVHMNLSRGLSGASPRWSVGLAFGTAFPYLNHLGAGSSLSQVTQGLGAGTHGGGSGTGGTSTSGRGGRKP